MEAVAFQHLDKSFGAVAALRDVTFGVTRGESHAIVGENGAGKSTLLNILAGSLSPDRGQLTLGGVPVALASPRDALARVGRSIPQRAPAPPRDAAGEPRLRVSGLTRRPCFEDVSLSIAPGEIVGLFGLVGSGRTEILETLAGVDSADRGSIVVDGRPVRARSPRAAARAGVVLVPEDRQRQGLCFNLSLRHNLVLPAAATRGTLLIRGSEVDTSAALIREWRITTSSTAITPDRLSGGNQQKIVLAKWLALAPRVLLLDEPTKGVDVAAKYDIHGIILELAARGTAVLVVSSDLPEVLALADRVLVMREGGCEGELAAGADEERVMRLATTAAGDAA